MSKDKGILVNLILVNQDSNTELSFDWAGIFATYCGIDMWNLPTKACTGLKHQDASNLNKTNKSH